jgi:hypothetical protein
MGSLQLGEYLKQITLEYAKIYKKGMRINMELRPYRIICESKFLYDPTFRISVTTSSDMFLWSEFNLSQIYAALGSRLNDESDLIPQSMLFKYLGIWGAIHSRNKHRR